MSKIIVFALSLVLFFTTAFGYIVKIGNVEISKKEFQDFIDVQKFIDSVSSFDELARNKKTTKNNLLTDYIDQFLVVREAKKKGYNEKNTQVQEQYKVKKEKWLTTLYITRNVDLVNVDVSDEDMEKTFNELPASSRTKPYAQLTQQEKQNLYQIAAIKVAQDRKKSFQYTLEKKFKVKRYSTSANIVAEVEGKKISKKTFSEKVTEQLARIGLNEKMVEQRDKARFEQAKRDILDELIFDELVQLDMKKSGFLNNKLLDKAYGFLMEQVITEQFVVKEIAPKVQIDSREIDQAFVQFSQQNPAIKNMLPTEQERILRNYIVQAKLPQIIKEYLTEIKEGILIKRNKEELTSVS